MWTPRRISLVLLGFTVAILAYVGYSFAFGSVDGLPRLPEKYLIAADGQQQISNGPVSRTERRLAEAFGATGPELTDNITYKTRIELQEKRMVLAGGPPNPDGTPFVTVSPISVAQFGKAGANEIREISTFHADKARLKFDRNVNTLQDLNDKAKLVDIELISNPDLESTDPRRGLIWITSNQRSLDPNDLLVIRTPGPLFYRVPDEHAPYNAEVAHVWTAASVEVIDRRNLPRMLRGGVPTVALARPDDLRRQFALADILLGYALPPPTVTADGMQIFLGPAEKTKKGAKSGVTTTGSSVRELLLQEKVQMNIWGEGSAGMPGSQPATAAAPATKGISESPLAFPSLLGSVWDGAGVAEKLANKTLLMIETPGSFRYRLDESTAKFNIAPQEPPAGQPNLVTVTRLSASKGQDNLFCTELFLDFSDPDQDATTMPAKAGSPRESGLVMRSMRATGPQVFISVEADGLTAQGTELRYIRDSKKGRSVTTLRGSPAYAKQGGSQIWGGDAVNFADIIMDSLDATVGNKTEKSTTTSVNGPGRLELFDSEQRKVTGTASWGKSLRHEKIAGEKREILKFEGPGRFADTEGDMRLSGDKLWLWLATTEKPAAKSVDGKATASSRATPEKLIAEGNVESTSPDLIIQKTDKLFVNFRDVPPPKLAVAVPLPLGPLPPAPLEPKPIDPNNPLPSAVIPPPAAEPEPPNPTHLSAAVIHANVIRYPLAAAAKDPKKPGAAPTLKYELETALCEERVVAYQNPDPKDLNKPAIGLLIKSNKLNLEQSAAGSVMVCTGIDDVLAEVHFEGTSLYGPVVEIDQPNNTVKVNGRGKLRMASSADLNGKDLSKPSDLEVVWAKEMRFYGARSKAEFLQSVNATQVVLPDAAAAKGPAPIVPLNAKAEVLPAPRDLGEPNLYTTRSTLQGHRLDLTFDRPVYFNQLKKKEPKAGDASTRPSPKLKTAVTTPIPDDERAQFPGTPPRDVYFLEEVFDDKNKYVSARRLRAKQIDFANRAKEQELFAVGEGELRLLGYEKEDEEVVQPGAAQRVAKKPDDEDKGEMKLTVVYFAKQLLAKDQGKTFQKAVFDKGAVAYSIPTENLNLQFERHALPKKSTMLSCVDSLTVSKSQTNKATRPVQWMVANGNAEFRNDSYLGIGGKVTYNGSQFVFDGTPNRLATLSKLNVGAGQSEYHQAEQLIYKKDGTIKANKSGGGTFSPGG